MLLMYVKHLLEYLTHFDTPGAALPLRVVGPQWEGIQAEEVGMGPQEDEEH